MQNDRNIERQPAEKGYIAFVIELTGAGGQMSGIAVVIKIFGVGDGDMVTQ